MNQKEYEKISTMDVISAEELINKSDRTLLYGYTLDRHTFHVYLKNEKIHTVIYDNHYLGDEVKVPANMKAVVVNDNSAYIPSKRVYPVNSDFEFCSLLKLRGCNIPFTFYEEGIEEEAFYGFTLEDCQEA